MWISFWAISIVSELIEYLVMFFDKVITEQSIIYGIPTRLGPNKLKLKYYGLYNWESKFTEYKKSLWIGLRGKASTNNPPDKWGRSLGISV